MRRRIVFAGIMTALAVMMLVPAASAGRVDFRAPLSHAQETGDVRAPGASGSAVFWVDGGELHYRIDVRHLTGSATMAHIHASADRHADAGIAIWLCGSAAIPGPAGTPACSTATTGHLVQGSVDADMATIALLESGLTYVNVHTVMHPPGEVRGQILTVGGR